nr:unnamed protein product [Haemonchus contortus]
MHRLDFIMNTERITQHSAIQGHCVETSYEEALRAVRQELKEDVIKGRPRKEGYVGFIAGEGALALEKDGRRGEIVIKMAMTFDRVLEILEKWSTFRTWVIMWPIDPKMDEEKLEKLLKLVRSQANSAGKIVTIWPPVNERNMVKWRAVQELWSALDTTLQKIDDGNQFFATAGSKVMDGKLYTEAGAPEGSAFRGM